MPRWLAVGCALLCLLTPLAFLTQSAGAQDDQEEGNRYVSGTYGFQIRWDDRIWYVIEQDMSGGWENLTLSDGTSYLFFSAANRYDGNPNDCLDDVVSSLVDSRSTSDVEPITDADGDPIEMSGETRAVAAYSYTYASSNGDEIEYARYFDCQTMVVGQSVILAYLLVPTPAFETELNLARDVIDDLLLPSPGEAGQVFAAEGWRFSAVGAVKANEIDAAELAARNDRQWLVVVLDVTNTRDEVTGLSVRDFTLTIDGEDDPITIAPSSTVNAAEALGTSPTSVNRAVTFGADQTRRLTLAFLLPARSLDPILSFGDSRLPLKLSFVAQDDLDDLDPIVIPPLLREAVVNEVEAGGGLAVTYLSDDTDDTIKLVGVEGLTADDCHGESYTDAISAVVGTTVLVEVDPRESRANLSRGYVWTTDDDGNLTQLNYDLIVNGDSPLDGNISDARFGSWLTEARATAEREQRGLWGEC